MPKTRRVCGNCGSLQGPYDRYFVGYRKTGHYIFTCRIPLLDADGKRTTDKVRLDAVRACNDRREKNNAPAPKSKSATGEAVVPSA